MEETTRFPIEFTQEARDAIKLQLERRGTPDSYVRFGVKGGGCTGFQYVIEFDDKPDLNRSLSQKIDGVNIVVDEKSARLLVGTIVTYTKTLMKEGFNFENPNESSRCSCGKSFTV